ncbi:MAG TPA: T9SS type A sorting domain-containing protein, partial [Bacteroidota bacterium]|nr:T9SS type A sorting domain-containing protein [Bacteroidota bacterium]
ELDPRNGQPRMVWIQSVPSDTTVWTIKNNYYSVTTAQQNWYTKYTTAGVAGEGPMLTWRTNKKVDSVNAFKKVTTYLTKVPETGTAYMDWYRSPSGANKTKSQATFNPALNDYNRVSFDWLEDSLNCKYPTTASIYTAADGGKPVGALTWWNMTYTDVQKLEGTAVPTSFSLTQNYPNPFNPSTTLQYTVPKSSRVVLEVFNILGQSVAQLVNEEQMPGTYKATFNASALSSGVYLYRLTAGDFVQTMKMVLMK